MSQQNLITGILLICYLSLNNFGLSYGYGYVVRSMSLDNSVDIARDLTFYATFAIQPYVACGLS